MRLLLAVAALEDLDIQSVDIKTAYLYGDLDEEICKGNWGTRLQENPQRLG